VNEISVILKNNLLITTEEFKLLDRYSSCGKMWTLIYRPTTDIPYKITNRTVEYIFDPEALTMFCIVSQNVLASWETQCTRYLGPDDEFYLKDSMFIRPYIKHH
jgi:hypothetical protein